jgi:hypothetical protein
MRNVADSDSNVQSVVLGSWYTLPLTLQSRILSYLDTSDLLKLACVSKQLGRLGLAAARRVELRMPPADNFKRSHTLKRMSSLKKQGSDLLDRPQLEWLRTHGSRVQTLIVSAESCKQAEQALEALLGNVPHVGLGERVADVIRTACPGMMPAPQEFEPSLPDALPQGPNAGHVLDKVGNRSLKLEHLELRVPAGAGGLSATTAVKLRRLCRHSSAPLNVQLIQA